MTSVRVKLGPNSTDWPRQTLWLYSLNHLLSPTKSTNYADNGELNKDFNNENDRKEFKFDCKQIISGNFCLAVVVVRVTQWMQNSQLNGNVIGKIAIFFASGKMCNVENVFDKTCKKVSLSNVMRRKSDFFQPILQGVKNALENSQWGEFFLVKQKHFVKYTLLQAVKL